MAYFRRILCSTKLEAVEFCRRSDENTSAYFLFGRGVYALRLSVSNISELNYAEMGNFVGLSF